MTLRPSLKFVRLAYILALVLAVAVVVYWLSQKGSEKTPIVPQPLWVLVVPGIIFVLAVVRHSQKRLIKLTILGDRLRYEAGLLSKSTRTIELAKVQDVRVDQSLGQRMVNIGNLSLETAGGSSRIVIQSIDRPQDAADHILELARAAQRHLATPPAPAPAPQPEKRD